MRPRSYEVAARALVDLLSFQKTVVRPTDRSRAGDRNRTDVPWVETRCSAIELRPRAGKPSGSLRTRSNSYGTRARDATQGRASAPSAHARRGRSAASR